MNLNKRAAWLIAESDWDRRRLQTLPVTSTTNISLLSGKTLVDQNISRCARVKVFVEPLPRAKRTTPFRSSPDCASHISPLALYKPQILNLYLLTEVNSAKCVQDYYTVSMCVCVCVYKAWSDRLATAICLVLGRCCQVRVVYLEPDVSQLFWFSPNWDLEVSLLVPACGMYQVRTPVFVSVHNVALSICVFIISLLGSHTSTGFHGDGVVWPGKGGPITTYPICFFGTQISQRNSTVLVYNSSWTTGIINQNIFSSLKFASHEFYWPLYLVWNSAALGFSLLLNPLLSLSIVCMSDCVSELQSWCESVSCSVCVLLSGRRGSACSRRSRKPLVTLTLMRREHHNDSGMFCLKHVDRDFMSPYTQTEYCKCLLSVFIV